MTFKVFGRNGSVKYHHMDDRGTCCPVMDLSCFVLLLPLVPTIRLPPSNALFSGGSFDRRYKIAISVPRQLKFAFRKIFSTEPETVANTHTVFLPYFEKCQYLFVLLWWMSIWSVEAGHLMVTQVCVICANKCFCERKERRHARREAVPVAFVKVKNR